MYYQSYFNVLALVLTIWALPWKVYSVWLAVKRDQKKWYVALLLLNTVGILELYYIFKVAKKSWTEVKQDFKDAFKKEEVKAQQ